MNELHLLNPAELLFSLDENGILSLLYQGENYSSIQLIKLFPFRSASEYIAVRTAETELGIIEKLECFPPEQKKMLENYLAYKYFIPKITEIKKVEEKLGYVYMDIETTLGSKIICIADVTSNIRPVKENFISVIDVQGNRYYLDGVSYLSRSTRRKIELYL